MVTGLFHLFEQQTGSLARELSRNNALPLSESSWETLKLSLRKIKVDVDRFQSHKLLEELALVANMVKHGDGRSSKKLRATRPDLFNNGVSSLDVYQLPLRPLVGEGPNFSADDFEKYREGIVGFYTELHHLT